MSKYTPITVFTGFLGAGKTTVILSLLPQLAASYKVVLLKNEFGDVEVDSQLAKQSSLTAVSEILNGCMCCILVGQMKNALLEIREKYNPDRIIIECSGSALPATLAFQIRELERETGGGFHLDTIATVIDAENFSGYEDRSMTAKIQASYTDIILINKWESVSERSLELVVDHLNTLNEQTPKIKTRLGSVNPELLFGTKSQQFLDPNSVEPKEEHDREVEVLTITKADLYGDSDYRSNLSVVDRFGSFEDEVLLKDSLEVLTKKKESVWRVKGFVKLVDGVYILNWAFGRYSLTRTDSIDPAHTIKLTVMGERGEVKRAVKSFVQTLSAEVASSR